MKKTMFTAAAMLVTTTALAAGLQLNNSTSGSAQSVTNDAGLAANSGAGMSAQGSSSTTMSGDQEYSKALFGALDTNADGKISEQEAQAERGLREHFGKVDADANGEVSQQEFMARKEAISETEEAE